MLPVDLVVNPTLISFDIPAMAAKRRASSMSRWIWSEQPQRRLDPCAGHAHRWPQPNDWAGPAAAGAYAPYGLAHERRHERPGAPAAQSTSRPTGSFLFLRPWATA